MKNIKEKLIVTELKMRSNLMTSKEKAKTALKDNKGSAVSYILILVAGVIITVVVMYPALDTLYESIAGHLQDWWSRVTTKVFIDTI
ncbi:MAG TPA: hypothetical protein PK733_08390 [Clostridiales bacterium]|nr:hypothetical protein [Clostridiales bacterium]